MLKDLFKADRFKIKTTDIAAVKKVSGQIKKTMLTDEKEGETVKCKGCGHLVDALQFEADHYVCALCGYSFRLTAKQRIDLTLDEGSFVEWDRHLASGNPLDIEGYCDTIQKATDKSGSTEAVTTGIGKIDGMELVVCVMDSYFMLGTMGTVVGERVSRALEKATEQQLPIVFFTCSGGARMQEGIFSLMQMAKTSAALGRHDRAGLLSITVLTDPTYGGVTASFAMLPDVILAEKGAKIGFAGPRVIAQTINQALPEGFQEAEFIKAKGFCDGVVERKDMKVTLSRLLSLHRRDDNGL